MMYICVLTALVRGSDGVHVFDILFVRDSGDDDDVHVL